jgi:hypothetical protein
VTLTEVRSLASVNDTVAGTWTITAGTPSQSVNGTCTGRVVGSTVTLVMTVIPATDACPFDVSGTLDATGTRMTGPSAAICPGASPTSGGPTITLVKQ